MTKVSLGDLVVCVVNKSVFEGIVINITFQGVVLDNFSFEAHRGKVVKWCNVLEIKQKSVNLPIKLNKEAIVIKD